jgi:hypothetical protein
VVVEAGLHRNRDFAFSPRASEVLFRVRGCRASSKLACGHVAASFAADLREL